MRQEGVKVPVAETAGHDKGENGRASGDSQAREKTSGKLPDSEQKKPIGTSGKTSGKSRGSGQDLPLVAKENDQGKKDLPLTQETDVDIELGEDVSQIAKGWRLEQNSDGYWRWRWQRKDNNGNPITYVNKSGNVGYKRGYQYVPINKVQEAKKEARRLQRSK